MFDIGDLRVYADVLPKCSKDLEWICFFVFILETYFIWGQENPIFGRKMIPFLSLPVPLKWGNSTGHQAPLNKTLGTKPCWMNRALVQAGAPFLFRRSSAKTTFFRRFPGWKKMQIGDFGSTGDERHIFHFPRWWFQTFCILNLPWGDDPIWHFFLNWLKPPTSSPPGIWETKIIEIKVQPTSPGDV